MGMHAPKEDKRVKLLNKKSGTYYLLSFLFPFLGIHRFMIGKWASGLFLLLIALPVFILVFWLLNTLRMDFWTCLGAAYAASWLISGLVDILDSYENARAGMVMDKQWKEELQNSLDKGEISREEYDKAKRLRVVNTVVAVVVMVILFVVLEFVL